MVLIDATAAQALLFSHLDLVQNFFRTLSKNRTLLSNSLFNGNTQVQAPKSSLRRRISQKLLFWFRSIAQSDKAADDMIQHARIWISLFREHFFHQDREKEIKSRRRAIYLELHVQTLGCVVNALIFPIKGRTHVNRARWMWKRSSFVIVFQPFKCIRLKPQWPLYGRIICVMAVRVKKFATPYLQRRSIGDNANFWKCLENVVNGFRFRGTMMSPHICPDIDKVEENTATSLHFADSEGPKMGQIKCPPIFVNRAIKPLGKIWRKIRSKKYFLFPEIQSVELRFAVQPHFPNVILSLLKGL